MTSILPLLPILGALLLGAISPGPSFVFVARTRVHFVASPASGC